MFIKLALFIYTDKLRMKAVCPLVVTTGDLKLDRLAESFLAKL